MKIYIAGPMRGYPEYNFPAFEEAENRLQILGHEVKSPHRMDLEIGFDPRQDAWTQEDSYKAIRRDVEAIIWCDVVVMLPGWDRSVGARAEHGIGQWAGKTILPYEHFT